MESVSGETESGVPACYTSVCPASRAQIRQEHDFLTFISFLHVSMTIITLKVSISPLNKAGKLDDPEPLSPFLGQSEQTMMMTNHRSNTQRNKGCCFNSPTITDIMPITETTLPQWPNEITLPQWPNQPAISC